MPDLVYGAVAEYLRDRFGGLLDAQKFDRSIGTTVGLAADRDPERVFLLLINLSANDIFVAPDTVPSTTHGIRLAANGGGFSTSVRDDGVLPSLEWNAIANAAASSLYVLTCKRDTLTGKVRG